MADPNDAPEGWRVPERLPLLAAMGTLVFLLVAVLAGGWVYDRTIKAERFRAVTTFPAPGVETFVHDGVEDPHRPNVAVARDPAIERAKRSVAEQGIAGWAPAR